MRKWKALTGAVFAVAFLAGRAAAQPTVEELQRELEMLRAEMTRQREDFEGRLSALQTQVDTSLRAELESQIEDIVARKSKFYRRPPERGRLWGERSVFDALEGGLIFTGLFRSRFEYRANNVDFNFGPDGLDDEGVRFNGRFRLGFGAVIVRQGHKDPTISALTEFQAVGTFANNTFFTFAGPGGVPLPTEFTIFKEPFEQVGIYQGYLSFERILSESLYFKVGRQEIMFGNEFVLGNNSFYDGTVHDGILAEFERPSFRISAFYAKEAQSDTELAVIFPAQDFDEDQFMGAYIGYDVTDKFLAEAYGLYFDARSNFTDSFVTRSTNFGFDGALNPGLMGHFWTLGARLFWRRIELFDGLLAINAEAAYQTGKNNVVGAASGGLERQSLHGWAGELMLNYWINPQSEGLKPILTLAYYYAGGGKTNPNTESGYPLREVGFQPLFINRHFNVRDRFDFDNPYHAGGGRYGNMDLVPLNNAHLVKAALTIGPSPDTELGISYLLAITADNEGFGTGIFGHEIDLFGSYQYSDYIQFAANLSVFFPQRTAEDASRFYFFSGFEGDADNDIALAFYLQALIEF